MTITGQALRCLTTMLFFLTVSLAPTLTQGADLREGTAPSPPSMATVQSTYGQLPLSFEANHGQWEAPVQFVTRGHGHTLFVTPAQAVLSVRTGEVSNQGRAGDVAPHKPVSEHAPLSHAVVRMNFEGADPTADVVGLDPLPGIVNYFIGKDPSTWRTNIPTYGKIGYKDVYPGIDLVYYGNQGRLEYDFIVAAGADPTQIRVAFDGAERIAVDAEGDLVLTLPHASTDAEQHEATTLRLHKPVVYQRDAQGEQQLLAGTYVIEPSSVVGPSRPTPQVAFQVAAYDRSRPLIIDPVLSWATYLGGSLDDFGVFSGIAVDAAGNAYVTGETGSSDFPTTAGSVQETSPGGFHNVFVTKLNATGTAIVYSTYLGGSSDERGTGIAVDATGNAYVTGETGSSDFPGTAGSAIQRTHGGFLDAFVTKLNATGTAIVYSTYLGGSGVDRGIGIAVDASGNAYVTGVTASATFPGTADSTIQSTNGGNGDVFVTKLNAAGTALVYSTYLGGGRGDRGAGIAVDAAGNAYVSGTTNSFNFPVTAGSVQSTFGSGSDDAFVTKLNAAGTALVYSTYLGGNDEEIGHGIAVDTVGNAYVTGYTRSSNFPGTAGSAIQNTVAGSIDVFVTKLNAAGTALVYSTYLGGSNIERGDGIAVDAAENVYVTGFTGSPNFPGAASSTIQSTHGGNIDAFVAKITEGSSSIPFAAFDPRVKIDVREQEFELKATFTLGSGTNGIAPLTEAVTIQVGTFSATIPAGSFKQYKGRFVFEGTIHGVKLEVELRSLILGNDYEVKVEGHGADLTGITNSVTVSLTIGNDSGSKAITAKME